MADMSTLNFDPNQHDPNTGFQAIPGGDYTALVEDSDLKTTKNGNGQYLQLTWQIIEGSYAGRKLFQRLNVNNPNKTAEDIGRRELAGVCQALGITHQITDSAQLHNIAALLRVGVVNDDEYGDINGKKNEVKGAKPLQGGGGAGPTPPQSGGGQQQAPANEAAEAPPAGAQAEAAGANTAPPWKR